MLSDASKSAGSQGESLASVLRAGNRAFEARDYADAARQYARVVAVDGHCASAWYRLGNARWRRGDRVGSIEAYRRAVGEEPTRARAWQNLSTVELSVHAWSEAAIAATKAVSLDPTRSKAWNNLAVARFAQGDHLGAETALRRAVETAPNLAVAWANLGRLLADSRRPDAARAAYERALSLGETDVAVRLGLATVFVALGEGARAEDVLEAAVRAEPLAVDAWVALGDVRRSRSAHGPALEAYEAASAAAEDMPAPVRHRSARRRCHAALVLAAEALDASDRDEFTRAADRLRQASEASGDASVEDEVLKSALDGCLDMAHKRSTGRPGPEWIMPERVRGVLLRALSSRSEPADRGGGGS